MHTASKLSNPARFPKSAGFSAELVLSKIMGPNPLKLCEELLADHMIEPGATVLDLGSGTGIASALLCREYGFNTYAVDLWSEPEENRAFFNELGLPAQRIHPVKADASQGLPFEEAFFDAVVSIDSFNYFGREPGYLEERLLPYVKPGGMLYLCIPGMVRDCHSQLPSCLLESWTPEQLDYMHSIAWWAQIIDAAPSAQILELRQMSATQEAWEDWLACDNEYAAGDRAAVEAGALRYLNTIAIVLRKNEA